MKELAKASVDTTAFVRRSSSANKQRQAKLSALEALGVHILEGSLDAELADLAQLLRGFNVVISLLAMRGEASVDVDAVFAIEQRLVEAAKQAGTIDRFIPAAFGSEFPLSGKYADPVTVPPLKSVGIGRTPTTDALVAAGVPFTHVICYAFMRWTLPTFGDFAPPGVPMPAVAKIYGDGNVPGLFTAEEDVAKVLVKVINDPRASNRKLIIRGQARTQNEMVDAFEAASGKKLERVLISREQLEQQLQGADGFMAVLFAVLISFWFNNIASIPPDHFDNFPHVTAAELYPDFTFTTIEDYYGALP